MIKRVPTTNTRIYRYLYIDKNIYIYIISSVKDMASHTQPGLPLSWFAFQRPAAGRYHKGHGLLGADRCSQGHVTHR